MIARRMKVPSSEMSDLPDIPLLGSGFIEDILALEERRLMRQPDLLKMSGENALKYSLIQPD